MAYYGTQVTPLYKPRVINILSISNSNPAIIVTTLDGVVPANNGYITGLIARIVVPPNFGMEQINKRVGIVTVISASSFSIDIDTTSFDTFAIPPINPGHNGTAAQVNAFGELTSMVTGAFVNIYQQ